MNARMLQRPIYGGIFGRGVYALATQPTITNGLQSATGAEYARVAPHPDRFAMVCPLSSRSIQDGRLLDLEQAMPRCNFCDPLLDLTRRQHAPRPAVPTRFAPWEWSAPARPVMRSSTSVSALA